MSAQWYVRRGNQVLGPYSSGEVQCLAAEGRLSPHDQLSQDLQKWRLAGQSKRLQFARTTPTHLTPPALSQQVADTGQPRLPSVTSDPRLLYPAQPPLPPQESQVSISQLPDFSQYQRRHRNRRRRWKAWVALSFSLAAGVVIIGLWCYRNDVQLIGDRSIATQTGSDPTTATSQHDNRSPTSSVEVEGNVPDRTQRVYPNFNRPNDHRRTERSAASPTVFLTGHSATPVGLQFSEDSTKLLSGSHDHTVRLWDTKKGITLQKFVGHKDAVFVVAFVPNSNLVVSASADKTIRFWRIDSGNEERCLKGHSGGVNALAVSSDGHLLVTGSQDGTARVWNVGTGDETKVLQENGNGGTVTSIAFSPNGSLVAISSITGEIRLYNTRTWEVVRRLRTDDIVLSVVFAPDEKTVLSAGSGIRLWDVESGIEYRNIVSHSRMVTSVACHPDGHHVVSSGPTTEGDDNVSAKNSAARREPSGDAVPGILNGGEGSGCVELSEVTQGVCRLWRQFGPHTARCLKVAVSPDGRQMAVGLMDPPVIVIEDISMADSYSPLASLPPFPDVSLTTGNGKTILRELRFPTGITMEQTLFVDGSRHGASTTWWSNGNRRTLESWKHGVGHGKVQAWWPNATSAFEGELSEFVRVGTWRAWNEAGDLIGAVKYDERRHSAPQVLTSNAREFGRVLGKLKEQQLMDLYDLLSLVRDEL